MWSRGSSASQSLALTTSCLLFTSLRGRCPWASLTGWWARRMERSAGATVISNLTQRGVSILCQMRCKQKMKIFPNSLLKLFHRDPRMPSSRWRTPSETLSVASWKPCYILTKVETIHNYLSANIPNGSPKFCNPQPAFLLTLRPPLEELGLPPQPAS